MSIAEGGYFAVSLTKYSQDNEEGPRRRIGVGGPHEEPAETDPEVLASEPAQVAVRGAGKETPWM